MWESDPFFHIAALLGPSKTYHWDFFGWHGRKTTIYGTAKKRYKTYSFFISFAIGAGFGSFLGSLRLTLLKRRFLVARLFLYGTPFFLVFLICFASSFFMFLVPKVLPKVSQKSSKITPKTRPGRGHRKTRIFQKMWRCWKVKMIVFMQ